LAAAGANGNPVEEKLLMASSAAGRAFIEAALDVLARPETQEVVSRTLNAIGAYFQLAVSEEKRAAATKQLVQAQPQLAPAIQSLEALAQVSESLIIPVFARSTAIGSLMRRKIEPLTAPIQAHLRSLLTTQAT
jgi:hypothetical protein